MPPGLFWPTQSSINQFPQVSRLVAAGLSCPLVELCQFARGNAKCQDRCHTLLYYERCSVPRLFHNPKSSLNDVATKKIGGRKESASSGGADVGCPGADFSPGTKSTYMIDGLGQGGSMELLLRRGFVMVERIET